MTLNHLINILNRRTGSSPPIGRRSNLDEFGAIIKAKKKDAPHDQMTRGHPKLTHEPDIAKFKEDQARFNRMSFDTAARNTARALLYGTPPPIARNEPATQSTGVKRPYSAYQTYSPKELGYHSLTLNEVLNRATAPVTPANRAHSRPNLPRFTPPSGYFTSPTQSPRIFETRPIAPFTVRLAPFTGNSPVNTGPTPGSGPVIRPNAPYRRAFPAPTLAGRAAIEPITRPISELAGSSLDEFRAFNAPYHKLGHSALVQNRAPSEHDRELARSSLEQFRAPPVPDNKLGRSALVEKAVEALAISQKAARDQAESGSSRGGALQAKRSDAVVNYDQPHYAVDGGVHLLPNPPAKRRKVNQPKSPVYVDDSDANTDVGGTHTRRIAHIPKQDVTPAKKGRGRPCKAVTAATTPAAPSSGKGKGRATSVASVEAQTEAQPAQSSRSGVNAPPSQGVHSTLHRLNPFKHDRELYSKPMSPENAKASKNKQNLKCICCGLYKPKPYSKSCFGYDLTAGDWLCKNCHSAISTQMTRFFGKGVNNGGGQGHDIQGIFRDKVKEYRAYIERKCNIIGKTKQTSAMRMPRMEPRMTWRTTRWLSEGGA